MSMSIGTVENFVDQFYYSGDKGDTFDIASRKMQKALERVYASGSSHNDLDLNLARKMWVYAPILVQLKKEEVYEFVSAFKKYYSPSPKAPPTPPPPAPPVEEHVDDDVVEVKNEKEERADDEVVDNEPASPPVEETTMDDESAENIDTVIDAADEDDLSDTDNEHFEEITFEDSEEELD